MSRQIDLSDPSTLSDEDRAYVMSRGRVDQVQLLRQFVAVEAEEVDEPYSEWDYRDLVAEAKNRGLGSDGKKEDIVARLEENDSASE